MSPLRLGQRSESPVGAEQLFAPGHHPHPDHELEVHEAIEEEISYPALKEHPKAKELVLEAYEEHNLVDMVVAEIDETPFDDETLGAKLTVMKENIEHHIDEEESEMFPQARKVFERSELTELGGRMQARKDELPQART
jgi:hemerythrin-like domain-containing protein